MQKLNEQDKRKIASDIATIATNYNRAVKNDGDKQTSLSDAAKNLIIVLGPIPANSDLFSFFMELLRRRRAIFYQDAYVIINMFCW